MRQRENCAPQEGRRIGRGVRGETERTFLQLAEAEKARRDQLMRVF